MKHIRIQRPIRRNEKGRNRSDEDAERLWPFSAREFLKLPTSVLTTGRRSNELRERSPADRQE